MGVPEWQLSRYNISSGETTGPEGQSLDTGWPAADMLDGALPDAVRIRVRRWPAGLWAETNDPSASPCYPIHTPSLFPPLLSLLPPPHPPCFPHHACWPSWPLFPPHRRSRFLKPPNISPPPPPRNPTSTLRCSFPPTTTRTSPPRPWTLPMVSQLK